MSTLHIPNLLEHLPHVGSTRMVHSGLGLWVAWDGQLDPGVETMLHDYGGFCMVSAVGQALWFFFGEEGLRALGRIHVWGRVNAMPVFIEVFPATMLISPKFELSLSISVELSRQYVTPSESLEILIHSNLKSQLSGVPGLSSSPAKLPSGLARVPFEHFEADPALSYDSGMGWMCVIKPLGDPLSRDTAEGWRNIAAELLNIVERMNLKFLRHEGFLIFEVSGLRHFQVWCRDTVSRIMRLKEQGAQGHYWPSVMAAVPSKGRTLAKDLPRHLALNWDKLTPDFPHMSYRSAMLLGPDFIIHEARALSRGASIEDWCNVGLLHLGEDDDSQGELTVPLPAVISGSETTPCFYCGLTNHQPSQCPSRLLSAPRPEVWERFGRLDMAGLEEVSQKLDTALAGDPVGEMTKHLSGTEAMDTFLAAFFEIGVPYQMRMLDLIWRSRGKELPSGLDYLGARESGYYWQALEDFRAQKAEDYETHLLQTLTKYPRGYQPKCLQGFAAMEVGDWTKAVYYWQEAGRLCYTPLQRGYINTLQGRAMEVQGELHKAIALYRESIRDCPKWIEPAYRQGVCLVKMGFTDQGMQIFTQLIVSDANLFNRIMIDPELERGRLHILAALWRLWKAAQTRTETLVEALGTLTHALEARFLEGEEYLVEIEARIQDLAKLGKVGNYVAYKQLEDGVENVQEAVRKKIDAEIKAMQQKQDRQFEELKDVQREAAWFPFPALLREFNRDFNYCASKLNWMRTSPMKASGNFHKSREYLPEVDERIRTLRTRLITLRIVRDSTFFCMLLGRNFMWMEVVGLGLSLVMVPVFIYLFTRSGQVWVANMMEQQKWQLQKGLVIILTIAALGLASIKTALTFESKKRKLFKMAEEGKIPAKKAKTKKKAKSKLKAKPKGKAALAAAGAKSAAPAGAKGAPTAGTKPAAQASTAAGAKGTQAAKKPPVSPAQAAAAVKADSAKNHK